MGAQFAEVLGIGILVASVAGATAALYGRARRGSGRAAVAVVWIAAGVIGLTAIGFGLAPRLHQIVVLGGILATSLMVCAAVLGWLHARDLPAAQRRDAALGYPSVPQPSAARTVLVSGFVALIVTVAVIAPWMLVAAASAGISPERVTAGLISNSLVATPLVWIGLASVALGHRRRLASDADLLSRGIETRVGDAVAAAFREGYDSGREEGFRHAAFGTSWE